MRVDLDAYHEAFKAVVLNHIQTTLPPDEWMRFRAMASDKERSSDPTFLDDSAFTTEGLLDASVFEDSISVDETLVPAFKAKAVEIGKLEGQPVRYVSGEGIYIWGLYPSNGFTLSFWASYPAYPPGW